MVETVAHLLGERVSVTEMLRETETVRVATLLDAAGEADRVIETDMVRVTETVYVLDPVTVRVNGFVVTTGLPVTVMVLLPEMVMEGETVFVAKLVVGAGDAVKVTEGVKEPLGERWPLGVSVLITVRDPLTDWVGLAGPLTLGVAVPDKPMLGVTLPVELLAGLDDTDEDPVGHCEREGDTLLDDVRLLIAVELLLAHCVGVIEGLAVPTVAEATGEPVEDTAEEEEELANPVAVAPLTVAPTEPETAGLADTLAVELVEELGVPKLAEAAGEPVSDATAEEDAVPSPVALSDVSGLDEALATPEALSDVSGLDEALATPVALLAALVLATTLQDASGVPLTVCTGLLEGLDVPKLGELAAVALGDSLLVEDTLADPETL